MSGFISNNIAKKPNQKMHLTKGQIAEFTCCHTDPLYFIRNHIWIQHPTQGRQKFNLFDYQEDMVDVVSNNTHSILLTGRQLGKCLTGETLITVNDEIIQIETLINLTFRQKTVNWLEKMLLKLSK